MKRTAPQRRRWDWLSRGPPYLFPSLSIRPFPLRLSLVLSPITMARGRCNVAPNGKNSGKKPRSPTPPSLPTDRGKHTSAGSLSISTATTARNPLGETDGNGGRKKARLDRVPAPEASSSQVAVSVWRLHEVRSLVNAYVQFEGDWDRIEALHGRPSQPGLDNALARHDRDSKVQEAERMGLPALLRLHLESSVASSLAAMDPPPPTLSDPARIDDVLGSRHRARHGQQVNGVNPAVGLPLQSPGASASLTTIPDGSSKLEELSSVATPSESEDPGQSDDELEHPGHSEMEPEDPRPGSAVEPVRSPRWTEDEWDCLLDDFIGLTQRPVEIYRRHGPDGTVSERLGRRSHGAIALKCRWIKGYRPRNHWPRPWTQVELECLRDAIEMHGRNGSKIVGLHGRHGVVNQLLGTRSAAAIIRGVNELSAERLGLGTSPSPAPDSPPPHSPVSVRLDGMRGKDISRQSPSSVPSQTRDEIGCPSTCYAELGSSSDGLKHGVRWSKTLAANDFVTILKEKGRPARSSTFTCSCCRHCSLVSRTRLALLCVLSAPSHIARSMYLVRITQ